MFCPSCKDEFRAGFTRCAGCDVDLVERLGESPPQPLVSERQVEVLGPVRLADICGYLGLDEARHARDTLRAERIRAEIAIREPLEIDWGAPAVEEYWIRADIARIKDVTRLIGDPGEALAEATAAAEPEDFLCSECETTVPGDAASCPGCGERFEDD